ncbi:helix-turn-helix domain-containing protein [Nakamurella aerolata]|uniref:Transcriptional regulator n=1 Tax=Nakamurella aerolata TaxID=1656892 RepID=A0A848ZZR1_9ACTN|nr:helix-turn-helix domain-containing protein [Nakamurella aerolata]NNG34304.1 transcriptional regulator [Nakamurella aerolata]
MASTKKATNGKLGRGVRITGTDRSAVTESIRKRYESGESIRSLASDFGRSYGFVHRILTDDGVALRGRGGATRGRGKLVEGTVAVR